MAMRAPLLQSSETSISMKLGFTMAMDELRRMAVFAHIVQNGSLSAAARQLGISTSAVSQQLRALEQQAGVSLLQRSTRQLSLTEVGRRYYQRCTQLMDAARLAADELAAARTLPEGQLRLAAPIGVGRHLVLALQPWLLLHPALSLELVLADGWTDLMAERIDLAVRLGPLPDSDWMAQPLGHVPLWLCAAPNWVQVHGLPSHPAQLSSGAWLQRHGGEQLMRWRHVGSGELYEARAEGRLVCDNVPALQSMCEAGLGVVLLTGLDAAEAIAAGRLQRLLAGWEMGQLAISAVTPHRARQPAKVSQAIEQLSNYLQQLLPAPATASR